MTRVHVIGAAGYAASEVMRFVLRHPSLELGAIESASHAGEAVASHAPLLRTCARRYDGEGAVAAALEAGDVVVTAGTSGLARRIAPDLLRRGARVVDLSDDFRLHAHAGDAVYGFSERYRDAIRGAALIANPGCYPTASLLALWPLAPFRADISQVIVDAKSGITGAGRKPATGSLFAEVAGDVRAYGLAGHRHEAEIRQEADAFDLHAPLVFTPHVVPLKRGMLADCYVVFARNAPSEAALRATFERHYAGSPFVRLLDATTAPSLVALAGTNDAEIHVSVNGNVVRVISAIDNLGKGAAGQAVQNINLMLGFPEETALDDRAVAVS